MLSLPPVAFATSAANCGQVLRVRVAGRIAGRQVPFGLRHDGQANAEGDRRDGGPDEQRTSIHSLPMDGRCGGTASGCVNISGHPPAASAVRRTSICRASRSIQAAAPTSESRMSAVPQPDPGSSGSTAAVRSPTSSRAPRRRARHPQAAVGEPRAVPRCRGGRHPPSAGRRRRASRSRRSRSPRSRWARRWPPTRCWNARASRTALCHHARLSRRAAHRLPEPAALVRPPHRAAGIALRAA